MLGTSHATFWVSHLLCCGPSLGVRIEPNRTPDHRGDRSKRLAPKAHARIDELLNISPTTTGVSIPQLLIQFTRDGISVAESVHDVFLSINFLLAIALNIPRLFV